LVMKDYIEELRERLDQIDDDLDHAASRNLIKNHICCFISQESGGVDIGISDWHDASDDSPCFYADLPEMITGAYKDGVWKGFTAKLQAVLDEHKHMEMDETLAEFRANK
jgi:hypothetical protein